MRALPLPFLEGEVVVVVSAVVVVVAGAGSEVGSVDFEQDA
jgi:hypothetical protein